MKTWFITGASTGFGRQLAETVLQNGDQCVLTARKPEQLADLVALFSHLSIALPLDVTQPTQIDAALAAAREKFGAIDVLVNNAGYGLLAALEETDDARMERCLATNLIGPLRLMQAAIPIFREQKHGHIINISAAAAIGNYAGFGIYGAAKAGLEAASESVAAECAPFGVKVTLVVPGPFRTDFIARSLDVAPRQPEYVGTVGKFETFLTRINGKQPGDPRKAAEAIYQTAGSEKPPFRLVLGKYANDKFAKRLKALGDELEAWKAVGLPTDFTV
jgi:NAD(P)-dependent dehydrogenase (short-subunit alcohol dehydrogenase family)